MIAIMLEPAATRMALERMESYCAAHPDSPSAVRRPSLSIRSGLWIALLGPSVEDGIVGVGYSVEAALSAFDKKYILGLSPPSAE
jgi:hypothetical protein